MTVQLIDQAKPAIADFHLNARPNDAEADRAWISVAELVGDSTEVDGMLVDSAPMRKVLSSVARIAPYKTAVLVHGESGVGKELISRTIHRQGPSPSGPFVTFNCSNLVESLAESQLFGHIKGAFTDAREESLGYFRSANGGTLFLDEVGELPLKLQPKLLRAVESHEVQPVGSAHTYKVNIRLVCATNRDLKAMVKEGSFRADLYYRLNTTAITVPPLRERPESIPALIAYFIGHHSRAFGKNINFISRAALDSLSACTWPGNVRQLSHAIQSALMMTDSDRISLADLPDSMTLNERLVETAPVVVTSAPVATVAAPEPAREDASALMHSLDSAIERASKHALTQALHATSGNCVRAAELLGVSRYTVYRMINRYGVNTMRERALIPTAPVQPRV
jgi:transcriptional regulator with GAF, ATPase, and Fis domain